MKRLTQALTIILTMAKMTSKYQLTVPKALAIQAGLKPGDTLECEVAGETIRVRSVERQAPRGRSITERLMRFDMASERQRNLDWQRTAHPATDRGWTREELYER